MYMYLYFDCWMLYVGYVLENRLDVNAIIDNVVTSDLIRMCVFGSALYHCHYWRGRFVSLCRMHRPCRVIRTDYVMCAQFLFMDVIILFSRQTRVYTLLSEGSLILGICGQTSPKSTPHGRTS